MPPTFTLSTEDAGFLREQLQSQIAHLDDELVHTDKRRMQRALARDIERLRAIAERIAGDQGDEPGGFERAPALGDASAGIGSKP